MAGKYDTMQVCLNGHIITEFYDSYPENRKNFCNQCGAKTIHQCQECKRPIPGHYDVPGVISLSSIEFPPHICDNCGSPFPWNDQVKNEKENLKKESEMKEKLDRLKGTKIEVKVEGHGNVVNLGDIINSTIQNTIKLKQAGNDKIAQAITEVSKAVEVAPELNDGAKKEHLEILELLSKQALLTSDQRMPTSVLKPVINHSLATLGAVGSVASIWGTWGTEIAKFFLG